jgi:hypothetical protein
MPPAGRAGSRVLLQRVQLLRSTSPRKCAKDALEAEQAGVLCARVAHLSKHAASTRTLGTLGIAGPPQRMERIVAKLTCEHGCWVYTAQAVDQTRGCGSSGAESAATLGCMRPGAPLAERLPSASALHRVIAQNTQCAVLDAGACYVGHNTCGSCNILLVTKPCITKAVASMAGPGELCRQAGAAARPSVRAVGRKAKTHPLSSKCASKPATQHNKAAFCLACTCITLYT